MPRHKATITQNISAFLLVSNWAGWFESDMVGNPEDSFSRVGGLFIKIMMLWLLSKIQFNNLKLTTKNLIILNQRTCRATKYV